jgi:hypothetical protein
MLKRNALLNWIFGAYRCEVNNTYRCEMLEILKGIAYTSTECRKKER